MIDEFNRFINQIRHSLRLYLEEITISNLRILIYGFILGKEWGTLWWSWFSAYVGCYYKSDLSLDWAGYIQNYAEKGKECEAFFALCDQFNNKLIREEFKPEKYPPYYPVGSFYSYRVDGVQYGVQIIAYDYINHEYLVAVTERLKTRNIIKEDILNSPLYGVIWIDHQSMLPPKELNYVDLDESIKLCNDEARFDRFLHCGYVIHGKDFWMHKIRISLT